MAEGEGAVNKKPSSAARVSKIKSQKEADNVLLGSPTFIDLGNGRWRCVETGHDLPAREKESYSLSKVCRLALIDAALAKKNPLLNTFKPHPVSKSMLVCSLTGDVINKSEEHLWKHINGRRFLKRLEEKELERLASPEKVYQNKERKKKKFKLKVSSVQKNWKLEADGNVSLARDPETESTDPVGERWDFDDGQDLWESHYTSDQQTESEYNTPSVLNEVESMELSLCTKRLSIAVGSNSFARRKKKMKKT